MNQSDLILSHLKSGRSINPLQALELYGCFRLGARIYDLIHQGHNITSEIVYENGKHWAEYKFNPVEKTDNPEVSVRNETVPGSVPTQGELFN